MKKIVSLLGVSSLVLLSSCGKKDSSSSSAASDSPSTATIKSAVWISKHIPNSTSSSTSFTVMKFSQDGSSLRICQFTAPVSTALNQFVDCAPMDVSIDNDTVYHVLPQQFVPGTGSGAPVPPTPANPTIAVLDGNVLDIVDKDLNKTGEFVMANSYEVEILNDDMVLQQREPLVTPTPAVTLLAGSYSAACPFIKFWNGKTLAVSCLDPDYTYTAANPYQNYKFYHVDDVTKCTTSISAPVKATPIQPATDVLSCGVPVVPPTK